MKKLTILLLLIFATAQSSLAIQEKQFGHDKKMDTPAFSELNNQFFVPVKTEMTETQELSATKEEEATSSSRDKTLLPFEKIRLKTKKFIRNKKMAEDIKKHPEKYTIEVDKEKIEEVKNKLILECGTMEYFADKKEIQATGGAKLIFPQNNTTATADTMIYNQKDNLVKMINNVVVTRGESVMTGDYMQLDMNEEVGLMDNLKTSNYSIEMKAEKGYMYGDKTIQENGQIIVDKPLRLKFDAGMYGNTNMELKDEDTYRYSEHLHDSKFAIKSNHIIVNAQKDHDTITLKNIELYKNGKRILKMPSTTFYTNKAQDYIEGNYFELGSKPKLGMFAGPGLVLALPKGSTFKLMPILNYSGGIGIGGMGRFRSATNLTEIAYGSAANLFTLKGRQELDKNLYLQYGVNSYMDDGFVGAGWGRYIADMVYEKSKTHENFLGKDLPLTFTQRISAGYIQDDGGNEQYDSMNKHLYDKDHNKLESYNIGTSRFRYMAEAQQTLYSYRNMDKLLFADFSWMAQGSAAVYGTGDTQFIVRTGPKLRTQCKYWVQELGYYQSGVSDDTPIPIYDAYRYGKSNVYLRESIRLHKLLMLSWYGSVNLSNDAPDKNMFQESRFIIGIGPDDLRLNLGMDVIRQSTYIGLTMDMDAKGTVVNYDKMEIKNPDRLGAKNEEDLSEPKIYQANDKSKPAKLEKCQVTNIEDSSLRMDNEKI